MKIERETAVQSHEEVQDKSSVEFLHTGSINLNLAASCKGKNGGIARGRIANFVGDGSSGKTLLALELAAWSFHKIKGVSSHLFPPVKKIRIRYILGEQVMDFPVAEMYGKEFEESVEWDHDIDTVEAMGRDLTRSIQENKPGEFLLYVIDSLDSLNSEASKARFLEAAKKDKAEEDSYNTEKARYLSQSFFSNVCSLMAGKDVTIIVISQIREKIGVTFGEKYGRSGGKSLDFYTHQVCWLREVEKMKQTIRGEERTIGIRVEANFKRNKVAKPFRKAEMQILFDYGIDNLKSMIAYYWGPKVKEMLYDGVTYSRDELVKFLEKNNLEDRIAELVEEQWLGIERDLAPDRKGKF